MGVVNNIARPQEVHTETVKVYGNVIEFKDRVYQISNIAAAEIVNIPAPFPWLWLLGMIFGVFSCLIGWGLSAISFRTEPGYYIVGGGVGLMSLFLFWNGFISNDEGLLLLLNSGPSSSVFVKCKSPTFLRQILDAVRDVMNDNASKGYVFNLENCSFDTISDSVFVKNSQVGGDVVNHGMENRAAGSK